MTLLQQRERERELERERGRESERDKDRSTQALRELESRVQALVEQGLVRMERSPSGRLDVQVVPVVQPVTETGQSHLQDGVTRCYRVSSRGGRSLAVTQIYSV